MTRFFLFMPNSNHIDVMFIAESYNSLSNSNRISNFFHICNVLTQRSVAARVPTEFNKDGKWLAYQYHTKRHGPGCPLHCLVRWKAIYCITSAIFISLFNNWLTTVWISIFLLLAIFSTNSITSSSKYTGRFSLISLRKICLFYL